MLLIVTMAGRYERFREKGIDFPKYLLPWGEVTVLSAVLSELLRDKAFDGVYLVMNRRDEPYLPHVCAIMRGFQIPPGNLIVSGDTKGQAETGLLGISALEKRGFDPESPLAFHNIDTILHHRDLLKFRQGVLSGDGHLDVFESDEETYSFVRMEGERVLEIVEKRAISRIATSGLYGFRNARIFRKYFELSDGKYISSIYARMIAEGARVTAGEVHAKTSTIVLGTPDEYMRESAKL